MKRLPLLGFDRIRVQRHIQANDPALQQSLFQKLAIGSMVLRIAFCAGLSLAAGSASVVYAYATQDMLTVYREVGEDYNALTRRAENAARSLAQQRFDSDILQTRVMITVIGENDGQAAPILLLDVKREDWRRRPDPQFWATYYRNTQLLLDMNGNGSVQPARPAPPAVPEVVPSPAVPTNPAAPAPRRTTMLRSTPEGNSASAPAWR